MVSTNEDMVLIYLQSYCKGIKKAITGKALASACGMLIRRVQITIERLRRCGILICSNDNIDNGKQGYFIPRTSYEASLSINSMEARAKRTLTMCKVLKRSITRDFGVQTSMECIDKKVIKKTCKK